MSNLLNGRIAKVSIEKLLAYADRLRIKSRIDLRSPAGKRRRPLRRKAA